MSHEQLSFDQALAVREAAIETAGAHASPTWRRAADEAVRWCAADLVTFTTDDVLARLAAVSAPPTHSLTALGPVMLAAARAGVITKTGEVRPSRIARRHRDLTVWAAPCRESLP